jgi:hypothetical protein
MPAAPSPSPGPAGGCAHCVELREPRAIGSPGMLWQLVERLGAMVAAGELAEAANPGGGTGFAELVKGAAWPADFLEYDFRCAHCGGGFRLEVETYHGSGGTWKPLPVPMTPPPPSP